MRWLDGLAAGVAFGLCLLADGIMDALGPGGFAGAVLVTALTAGGLILWDKLRTKREHSRAAGLGAARTRKTGEGQSPERHFRKGGERAGDQRGQCERDKAKR